MIWAILWCAYLAVGCAIVWREMPDGIAAIRSEWPDATVPGIWAVCFLMVLLWLPFMLASREDER